MKKVLPIILVVLLVGAGYYFYSNKTSETSEKDLMEKEMMVDEKKEEALDKESFTGDLKTLIAKNIPMMCSFEIGGYKYNAWVKGDRVKSEYVNPQGKGTVIVKENCMYTWAEGEEQGVKICTDPVDGDIWDDSEYLPDEYYCVPSIIADSVFDPPSDVEFLGMDMMMQMEGLEEYMQQ